MKRLLALILSLGSILSTKSQQTIILDSMSFVDGTQVSSPICHVSTDSDGIIVSYEFKKVNIYPDIIFPTKSIVHIDNFSQSYSEGVPSLPVHNDAFLIPVGKKPHITILDSTYIDIPMSIGPAKPRKTEWEADYTKETVPPILPFSGFFPKSNIASTSIRGYRNNDILDVCINPVKYSFEEEKVLICKKLVYKIQWINNRELSYAPKRIDSSFINRIVLNKTETNTNRDYSVPLIEDYLIVTTPTFINSAMKFAEWKRMLGFRTHIATNDTWTADSIKDVIRSFYNDSNKNLTYLLLIGDENDVPPSSYRYRGTGIFPVDLYYSCMDGGNDYVADIFMGRLSARTNGEAMAIINKIINYERAPVINEDFYNSTLVSSYFQAKANHPEIDGRTFVRTTEDIKNYLETQGKTTYRVYNADFLWFPKYWYNGNSLELMPDELQDSTVWTGNGTDIKEHIDRGMSIVFHRDHGQYHRWPFIEFYNDSIAYLNNGNKLPVVFSIDCDCGQYNYQPLYGDTDCFAEAFLKKEDGGCVAIIAATDETYSSENDCLAKGLFEAIWPYPGLINNNPAQPDTIKALYRMGEILEYGLQTIKRNGKSDLLNRTLYICFGDPSMRLYTECPRAFNNISINRNADSIVVDTDGEEAQMGFYNRYTGEICCFYGTHINCSMTGDSVSVCISAPNRIPYIDDPTEMIYIQNENISNNRTYQTKKIAIGSNVTNFKPSGSVVFSGGNISITTKEAIIEGETTIELGTSLEIKNQ